MFSAIARLGMVALTTAPQAPQARSLGCPLSPNLAVACLNADQVLAGRLERRRGASQHSVGWRPEEWRCPAFRPPARFQRRAPSQVPQVPGAACRLAGYGVWPGNPGETGDRQLRPDRQLPRDQHPKQANVRRGPARPPRSCRAPGAEPASPRGRGRPGATGQPGDGYAGGEPAACGLARPGGQLPEGDPITPKRAVFWLPWASPASPARGAGHTGP